MDALLGLNVAELHISLEEHRAMEGGPVARLTPLGWVCFGPTVVKTEVPTFISATTMPRKTTDKPTLEEMV